MSRGGGTEPTWGAGGRELYCGTGRVLMMAAIDGTTAPQPRAPVVVFEAPVPVLRTSFAPAPDGSRFVILVTTQPEAHSLKVAVNWTGAAT